MGRLLDPPRHIEERTDAGVDADYKKLRNQVFLGAFIGYAAFYIVRKNFSMAIPMLEPFGFRPGELGTVLAMNAIAYALSKFLWAAFPTVPTPASFFLWDYFWRPYPWLSWWCRCNSSGPSTKAWQ